MMIQLHLQYSGGIILIDLWTPHQKKTLFTVPLVSPFSKGRKIQHLDWYYNGCCRWIVWVYLTILWGWRLQVTSTTKQWLLKICHLRHRLRMFLFHRQVTFSSRDIQFFVFLTIHVLPNLWRHDEYEYMRQGAFFNISFEPQLINPPNLVNW